MAAEAAARPPPGVCPVAVGWEELAELIKDGSVGALAKLGRSEADLAVYRKFMAGVREEYRSVADFIKIVVFEAAVHLTDGKKCAVDSEHGAPGEGVVWRPNDFPYNFAPGMAHWLLWARRELPAARIQALMAERFPAAEWDAQAFTNPPELQSILSVWHCHVIVRPKGQRQP